MYYITCLLFFCVALASTVHAQHEPPVTISNKGKAYDFSINTEDTVYIQQLIDSNLAYQYSASDAALQLYQYTFKQSKRLDYHHGIIASALILGNIYQKKGLYPASISVLQRAEQIALQSSAGKAWLATIYNNSGGAYRNTGQLERATQYYLRAVKAIEQYPASRLGVETVYLNLVATIKEDKEKVLLYLGKAESIARKNRKYPTLGTILMTRSFVYLEEKKWEESERLLQETLQIGTHTNDPLLQYRALMRLGNLMLYQNKPALALDYFNQANKDFPDTEPDISQRNYNIYIIGVAYSKIKDYKKAEYYITQSLDTANKYGLKEQVAGAHSSLSFVYAQQGQYKKAYQHQLLYKQIHDSVMNSAISANIQNMEARYQASVKDKNLAEQKLLIDKQKRDLQQRNVIITTISVLVLLLGAILFLLYRNRKKELQHRQEVALLKGMISGEEKERGRLARELHDGIGGMLATIKMNVGAVKVEHPETAGIQKLDTIAKMLEETGNEVRRTAHNLMPDILTGHDLEYALQNYCNAINAQQKLTVELQAHGDLLFLSKAVELLLYRIVQELLQNVIKHAHAHKVVVQVDVHNGHISIVVEDDGVGFDSSSNATHEGFGLQNLSYRVHALHGQIEITSAPGKGTTAYIEFDQAKLEHAFV